MDQVEEVKRKLDIVEVINGYVPLKRGGKNFKGLCPFHGEKTPSFIVTPELGMYKCFGCGKSGDAISFVQEMEGWEFPETLRFLADKVGVKLEFKESEGKSERERMLQIHEWAAEYYHYLLTKHKLGEGAREYVKKRKIGEKLIETFRLGYALPMWEGLRTYLNKKKKVSDKELERAGLVLRSSGGKYYDRFRGRVMIPMMDERGRVVGFAGRIMPGAKEDEPKYINSPETVIYHKGEALFGWYQAKKAIREKDRVVLVEGDLDMISSFSAGITETVAVKGTAFTEGQLERIERLTRNLILALDADSAGEAAMKRAIQMAESKEMSIKVVVVEGGKDPDDIARENAGRWKKMVEGAIEIYDFYLDSALKRFDPKTVEGKRKISEEVVPIMSGISNKVVQAHYVKKLSGVLEVGEEWVMKELERVGKGMKVEIKEEKKEERSHDREEELWMEILAMVMSLPEAVRGDRVGEWLRLGMSEGWKKVVEGLAGWKGEVAEWVKRLPAEKRQLVAEAYMREVDKSVLERNLVNAFEGWKKLRIKKRLSELGEEIKIAEEKEDEEQLKKSKEEFVRLSGQLKG